MQSKVVKGFFMILLLLLSVSLTGCFGGEETMNLRGSVEDRLTAKPMAGVKVEVGHMVVETNANGYFKVEDIPVVDDIDDSDRMVKVATPGYRIYAQPVVLEAGDKSLTIELERSSTDQFFVVGDTTDVLDIYLTDVYGNRFENLTDNDYNDWAPDWSPTRKELLFLSDRSGSVNIHTMDARGENVKQITNTEADKLNPTWLEEEIIFTSKRDGDYNLYRTDLKDNYLKRLTDSKNLAKEPYYISARDEIIYISDIEGEFRLHSMLLDGSQKIVLHGGVGEDKSPLWSKERRQIIFANSKQGQDKFYQINPNGSGLEELFESDYPVLTTSLLDIDTLLLLYAVQKEDNKAIKLFSPSGEKRTILFDEDINYSNPVWKE